MTDGSEALSKISGLPKGEVNSIWEQVRENHRLLAACPRHSFDPPADGVSMGERYRCKACGGEIRLGDIGMYIKGYMAAGGDTDDIWPGWMSKKDQANG